MELDHELQMYIDNARPDQRFANLDRIVGLSNLFVDNKNDLSFFPLVKLVKLVLILPAATKSAARYF